MESCSHGGYFEEMERRSGVSRCLKWTSVDWNFRYGLVSFFLYGIFFWLCLFFVKLFSWKNFAGWHWNSAKNGSSPKWSRLSEAEFSCYFNKGSKRPVWSFRGILSVNEKRAGFPISSGFDKRRLKKATIKFKNCAICFEWLCFACFHFPKPCGFGGNPLHGCFCSFGSNLHR